MRRPLLIFGASSFAEIALEYFSREGVYMPVGLVVDEEFATDDERFGLPMVPLSEVASRFPDENTAFHVAVTYAGLNNLRRDKVRALTDLGYRPASYVSPRAYVDPSAKLGNHVFVFEDNTVQPFTTLGDGVILWSGNHIGHHSSIEPYAFVSSHVVVSGHCSIGENSFLGVNCTIANNVSVGADNWIAPGAFIAKDTGSDEFWRPAKSVRSERRPSELLRSR